VSLDELLGIALQVAQASGKLHKRLLEWAEWLGQARAYDSQYLALVEESGAELWTADERSRNQARQIGIS